MGLGLSIFFKAFGRESSQGKGKDKAFRKVVIGSKLRVRRGGRWPYKSYPKMAMRPTTHTLYALISEVYI